MLLWRLSSGFMKFVIVIITLELILMLLVANFAIKKSPQKIKKLLKPCHMGTHLRVLGKSYPMNTNMTGFK